MDRSISDKLLEKYAAANPDDPMAYTVYADWLDDHGYHDRASEMRRRGDWLEIQPDEWPTFETRGELVHVPAVIVADEKRLDWLCRHFGVRQLGEMGTIGTVYAKNPNCFHLLQARGDRIRCEGYMVSTRIETRGGPNTELVKIHTSIWLTKPTAREFLGLLATEEFPSRAVSRGGNMAMFRH